MDGSQSWFHDADCQSHGSVLYSGLQQECDGNKNQGSGFYYVSISRVMVIRLVSGRTTLQQYSK